MPNQNKKLFCVIPAYNEEKTIANVVNSVKNYVDEVVVVDDGSVDRTYKLSRAQDVKVLKHIINRGQGAALRTGTEYALNHGAEIIVHFDADGQFFAEEIPNIIDPIIKGEADMALGSRFLTKKSNMPRMKKKFIIPLARLANKVFLGINFTDPQNGFRAMSRIASEKIRIEQDEMSHCSEILHKIKKSNLKVKEVPVAVIYHNFGQRLSGGVKILKELFLGKLIN